MIPRPPFSRVLAVLIVSVALVLRAYALNFGLPLAEARPDELTIAFQAMKFGTLDFNPHSFNYPSLFKYLTFGLFGFYYAIGRLFGIFEGQEDFLRSFFTGAVTFRLWMRALSAVAGTVGVALLLWTPDPGARRPGLGGLAAAMLLAGCFLHVRDSHFGVTDITMVTLATGSVLLAHRLQKLPSLKNALIAGLVAGLTTSTKYNGALLCLPIALALIPPSGRPRTAELRLLMAAAAAMVGGFFAGSPYALLDFSAFWRDFSYETRHLVEGHRVDVGIGWVHHLTASLRYGMGIPLLLAGLGGVVVGFWKNRREAMVLYSFPIAYYLFIGRGETAFFRYILPVVPFLCMAAGAWLAKTRGALLWALAILSPSLLSTLLALRLMGAGDTRNEMGAWIEANVPTQARIVHAGTYSGAPMLQRNVENQSREYAAKAGRADVAGFRKPDDPRWYDQSRPAYDVLFIKKEGIDFASQLSVAELTEQPPEWLMVEDYFLVHYSAVPTEVLQIVEEHYELVHEERAWEGTVHPIFDQQDAFYLPVDGFSGFTRMGPGLKLYRRKS